MTNGQSASLSWCRAPTWDPQPIFLFLFFPQSHVTTDGWSVSQSVSMPWFRVHSGTCDFCLKVAVLSLWGALSDERLSLSFVSHCQQYLVHCQNFILFTFYMLHMFYVYTMPLLAQAQYSRSCPIICSLHYNSSVDTLMVVCLTMAKFKPLIFSL
jgi:hypothetical protein